MNANEKHERPAPTTETGEELPSDQWRQFERAVDAAVKSGPKRRAIVLGTKDKKRAR